MYRNGEWKDWVSILILIVGFLGMMGLIIGLTFLGRKYYLKWLPYKDHGKNKIANE
jgi:uncharacterized protein YneF (UPF0154 family)